MKHAFAISAYGESKYLETCIKALLDQSVRTDVIICTSTPNGLITGLAEKFGIRLFVREGASGLKDDWNFAVETAVRETGATLVTVAHQDDIYCRDYVKTLRAAYKAYPDMSVFCTRYSTIDENGQESVTRAEQVKRILRLPLRLRKISDRRFIKRLPLIMGNGIGCPTCTYNVELLGLPIFEKNYHFVIDWDTLLRFADRDGRFICVEKELVRYRVHSGAETKKNIVNHVREQEEAEIFARVWPKPIVALIMHFYKKAYKDYDADAD